MDVARPDINLNVPEEFANHPDSVEWRKKLAEQSGR